MPDPVRIALLYPAVLGTYGDGGNARVLAERLRWRGLSAEVIAVDIDQPLPEQADLYVLGGGEDSAQTLAASRLADGRLRRVAEGGATLFAVCAGFQILGETFLDATGSAFPGLGILDCRTDRLEGPRAVGELLVAPELPGVGLLTGYENHGGRTTLGPGATALGTVRVGVGNGDRAVDGAVQHNVVATYLHGPALARNPALADYLLSTVVGELQPVDDSEAEELRRERIDAVTSVARLRARRQWRPPARDR
ncbi:MAG TPA: glutamine amidotransferase [Mycobacteriales bacterium]|nr:glutamine amidotransferase [Mycobacteriales bacterium]